MEIKRISKFELMKMFVAANFEELMPEMLAKSIEEHIPKMTKEQQKRARKSVKKLRRNPHTLYENTEDAKGDAPESREPIDTESESYKHFVDVYMMFKKMFEDNYDLIEDTFIKEFAENGVSLIIDD